MAAKSFYPNLSTIVTVDAFPEELQFIQNGLQNALDNIYFKELQYVKSTDTSQAYYNLVLITGEALQLDIFDSGFSVVINPGSKGETIIPVTLNYNWPVIALINNFDIENFSFLPEDLQNIFYKSLTLNDPDLILSALDTFEGSTLLPSFEAFVDRVNTFYGLTGSSQINYPNDSDALNMAEDVRWEIDGNIGISDDILGVINSVYIVSPDSNEYQNNLSRYSQTISGESLSDYINKIIVPKIAASLDLAIGLAFPRNLLLPLDAPGGSPLPAPEQSTLVFDAGTLFFNTPGGINFEEEMTVSLNHPSQIGKTGLGIDIINAKLDLSVDTNILEADLDGRSKDFIGVFTEKVAITLPARWFNNIDNSTLQIAGYNLLIGTGGISGTIALETVSGNPNNGNDYLDLQIGNWEVGFNYFNLIFHQNVITESNIQGRIKIPKLKDSQGDEALVYLKGHLNEEGDFNLTASEPEGIPFTFFDFVTINFLTLELGREDDNFYVGTSCQIWFDNVIMNKVLNGQVIEIPRLRIYDNGTFEIVGGTGTIPTNISLNLGPIEIAVTGIHYGSTQQEHGGVMRRYNYWGFDGAISLDPLGIDARGEGVKYYYTTDNEEMAAAHGGNPEDYTHDFIKIQTIEVDLIIPGTASPETALAIIHGLVSIPEPGVSEEYKGELSFKLPKARIAGGASMRLQPRYPAFILKAGFDIPSPIPLGATGLGFYGFGGLIGFRYVADKGKIGLDADATWYDYFTYPQRGVNIDKFSGPSDLDGLENPEYTNAFSIGAGTVLATIFDDGYLLSTRLMAILSLPQVFILDGRANVLGERLGMLSNDEPPFFAFVAIGNDSIEFGFGADYQVPKSNGWIIDLYAEVQAGFFFNNSSAWYVNFGTKQNPITATLFKDLLNLRAQGFLMLSAQGMEAGARLDFELDKKFGPFKVHIWAYLEVGGYISFERPQIGGYIAAGGGIDIDVWIIGISLALDALFSAEAPEPFRIYAEVQFRACVKIVFVKICKNFTVKLKWEKNTNVNRTPVKPLPDNRVNQLVKGIHMLTNETFDLEDATSSPPSPGQISKIIPLDTYIEFKTEKALVPGAVSGSDKPIGGYLFAPENHVDLIPPKKVVMGGLELRQVKHKYSIEDIEVKAWNGSNWVDYHPFEAVVPIDNRPEVEDLHIGYWQLKGKQYETLRLLATTPFTYMEAGEPGWVIPEQLGITPSILFCSEELREEDCSNVLNKPLGTKYYPPTQFVGHFINGAYYTLANVSGYEIINGTIVVVENEFMEVTDAENVHGFEQSLSFNNYNRMVIILPEASIRVKCKLTTDAQGVTIKYYRSEIDDTTGVITYYLVHEEYKTSAQLNSEVEYENLNVPMSKVEIVPDDPDIDAILDILEQIAQLFEITYDEATGIVNVSEPSDEELYNALLQQLEELKAEACGGSVSIGDAGCMQNTEICALYDELLALFESCFETVQDGDDVLANLPCFEQFQNLVEQVITMTQNFALILEYNNYVQILDSLYTRPTNEELYARFLNLMASAQNLLDIILDLGNCDCEPNKCDTSLQQICWMTLENHEWNETVPGSPAINEEIQDMIAGLEATAQPIWRPNTSYYVKFTLKDEVDNGESNPGVNDYYYGFKTVGPIGHYHKHPEVEYLPSGANKDEYPLTSIKPYIDFRRSYPNADGNLLKSKPLFYGNQHCEIRLFFTKPLAYHMTNKWNSYQGMPELDGALHFAIKDPVTDVVIPYPLPDGYDEETVPVLDDGSGWTGQDDPLLPPHIQMIIDMIEDGDLPCTIELGDPIVPNSSTVVLTPTNLKPQKLYTILAYNAFEVTSGNVVSEPVHEFVFQSSRYESFEKQVNSYLLDGILITSSHKAFELNISIDQASIDKAYDIVAYPDDQEEDPLQLQYQDLFDRVTEGVLGIEPMNPPERTEFFKVINTNTGDIIAVWIRNPEPFNDPKIPRGEIEDSIQVVFSNGNPNTDYKVLLSKDYSQAFIMIQGNNLSEEELNFKFIYKIWNGLDYEEIDEVIVENIIINE